MAGDELECPNCGAKVDVADHRCGACGAMLDAGELVAIPDPEEATREGEVEPDEAELAPPAEPQADLRPEPERGWFDRWGRVALYLSYVAVSVAGSWALHRWLVNRSGEEDLEMWLVVPLVLAFGYPVVWFLSRALGRRTATSDKGAGPEAVAIQSAEGGSWWSRLTANTAQMLGLVKLGGLLFALGGMAGVNFAMRRWGFPWPVVLGIVVWLLGLLGLTAARSYLLSRLHGTGKEAKKAGRDLAWLKNPLAALQMCVLGAGVLGIMFGLFTWGWWAFAAALVFVVAAELGLHLAIQRIKGPRQKTREEADAESEDAGSVRLVRDRPTRGESPERATPKRPGPGAKVYALDDPRTLRKARGQTGSSAPLVAAFVLLILVPIVLGAIPSRDVFQAVGKLGEQPPAFWVALAAVIACAAVLGALVGRHTVGVADTTDMVRDAGGCVAVVSMLAIQAAVVALSRALGAPVGWALGMIVSTVVSMGVMLTVHGRFSRRREAPDDDAGVGADEQPEPGEQAWAERSRLCEIRFTNNTNREITLHVSWHNPGDGWQEGTWTFVPEETSFLLHRDGRIKADRIRHWGEATDDTGTWHAGHKNTVIDVTSDEDPFFEFFYEGNVGPLAQDAVAHRKLEGAAGLSGDEQEQARAQVERLFAAAPPPPPPRLDPANNSGTGGDPPPEIMSMGFNWGAFFLNWIWGVAHGVWNSLFCLIPAIGQIWCIELGVRGSEWAWRSRRFESVEQFKEIQATWSKWGIIVLGLAVFSSVLIVVATSSTGGMAGEGLFYLVLWLALVWCVVGAIAAVVTVSVLAVQTIRRSDRPRADKWAAWSLFLGMASYPVSYLLAALLAAPLGALLSEHWCPGGQTADVVAKAVLVVGGLFPALAGIKALVMGGSRWLAALGLVLGGVTLAVGVVGIVAIAGPQATADRTIHEAAMLGDTEALALALDRGADVNARNERGWTPLHRAVYRGHVDVVQMLLEAGADGNAKHKTGQTPMSFARTEEMRSLLRQHGARR